jgi:pyruvate dehydrogenase (quinone)
MNLDVLSPNDHVDQLIGQTITSSLRRFYFHLSPTAEVARFRLYRRFIADRRESLRRPTENSMAEKVGDFILQRLTDWGVKRIFGYPGDGINGLMGAMGRAADRFDYIRVSHEEMAAFMACAHAKFTGEVGVCFATSGPGAIHLLNGLYDAKMDHMPVVAVVGQQARSALGSDYQQEVDLQQLFCDVATYVETIVSPAQARHVIDRAMRIAAAERAVACIIVPNDIQELDAVDSPPRVHGSVYSGVGYATSHPMPTDAELQHAADILNDGNRHAILVGAGALDATDQIIQLAEKLNAGVAKALLGKAALPDDLPYVTGSIGLLGSQPSWDLMNQCDTLLMIGTTFPYSEFLPEDGTARAVQIDLSPRNVSMRYPTECNLIGDSAQVLSRLLPLLKQNDNIDWREKIEHNVRKWWRKLEAKAMEPANPINPQRVFWELSPRLPDQVILCGDCGSHTNWYARDLKMRRGMKGSLSGKLATMGCGVPYAIAAKMAFPDRPVIAIVGDGAMQMNGNAELVTVKQYWSRWKNPQFIVMVLVNHDLNQVTWEQRALAGDPKFPSAQDVEAFPYAVYGEMLGLKGIRVTDPDAVGEAWEEALRSDRPVVIEFVTDPDVPPLPPHITWSQAKSYMTTMIKNDPNRAGVIKQSARQILAGIFPGGDSESE